MEQTTLGELVSRGRLVMSDGYRTRQSELGRPGVPILRASDVQDGYLKPSPSDYVRDEYGRHFASKVSRVGDVIVTTKGTVGRVARIADASQSFVYSPQLCFFRVVGPEADLDPTYLYYWFRGPSFHIQISRVKGQTDMADYVNLVDMRSIKISLPDINEQKRIAAVLGWLDDRIELNLRMNETLDALARAIFERA